MTIQPHARLGECPQLDYLLIPGGEGARDSGANEGLV
jgi:hypothetical protein